MQVSKKLLHLKNEVLESDKESNAKANGGIRQADKPQPFIINLPLEDANSNSYLAVF
jgi:hypothetical protein